MPGVTLVQANHASAGLGAYPGSIHLSCAYGMDNAEGNIGLCYITAPLASGDIIPATTLSDTNSNDWYLATSFIKTNIGEAVIWVCPWFKLSGPNTVTTVGLLNVSSDGQPNIMIVELQPPPCPLGTCGFHAFNVNLGGDYHEPFLELNSRYNGGQGQWYHSLIATIYDEFNNAEVTLRTWSAVPDPNAIHGGMIDQQAAPTGVCTAAMAYSVVPYPFTGNSVLFTCIPSTPVVPTGSTKVMGLLISTKA